MELQKTTKQRRGMQTIFTGIVVGVVLLSVGAGGYFLITKNTSPASTSDSYNLSCIQIAFKTYAVSVTINGKPNATLTTVSSTTSFSSTTNSSASSGYVISAQYLRFNGSTYQACTYK
jgi:flagellar basal body-associated protein FliL